MLLNVRADSPVKVPGWAWVGPGILVAVLLAELVYGLTRVSEPLAGHEVGPGAVSAALYGPYVLGVELASMLLLAALIGARHVAARARDEAEERAAFEHHRDHAADELLPPEPGGLAEEGEA